jgi:hypothetical protein
VFSPDPYYTISEKKKKLNHINNKKRFNMINEYKSFIESEILAGAMFEKDYSVDTQEHFALAPQDIVKIDLRKHISSFKIH